MRGKSSQGKKLEDSLDGQKVYNELRAAVAEDRCSRRTHGELACIKQGGAYFLITGMKEFERDGRIVEKSVVREYCDRCKKDELSSVMESAVAKIDVRKGDVSARGSKKNRKMKKGENMVQSKMKRKKSKSDDEKGPVADKNVVGKKNEAKRKRGKPKTDFASPTKSRISRGEKYKQGEKTTRKLKKPVAGGKLEEGNCGKAVSHRAGGKMHKASNSSRVRGGKGVEPVAKDRVKSVWKAKKK